MATFAATILIKNLLNRQINRILFCDTTDRKAAFKSEGAGQVRIASVELQEVSAANILGTTPIEAVAATVVENAIVAEAAASSRQG